MRTADATQRTRALAEGYRPTVWVEIRRPSGAWVELTTLGGGDWVAGVTAEIGTPDRPVRSATLTLFRRADGQSVSPGASASAHNRDASVFRPLCYPGREVRVFVAFLAAGESRTGAARTQLFHGEVESVDFADDVVLTCSSLDVRLLEARFREPYKGGAVDPGVPIGTELQALTGLALPGATLRVLGAPDWGVGEYEGAVGDSIGEQMLSMARQQGWSLAYRWSDAAGDEVPTLYLSPRDKTAADLSLSAAQVVEIPELRTSREWVRNEVAVTYPDAAQGKQVTTRREDAASVAEFGRRLMTITEGDDSPITTAAQAEALAGYALSDLAQPLTSKRARIPLLPWLELHDVLSLAADGTHYDFAGSWAVVGGSWQITPEGAWTEVALRGGSPVGMYMAWRGRGGVDPVPAGLRVDWAPITSDEPGKAGIRLVASHADKPVALQYRTYAAGATPPAYTREPAQGYGDAPVHADVVVTVPGKDDPAVLLEAVALAEDGSKSEPLWLILDDKWQLLGVVPHVKWDPTQVGSTGVLTITITDTAKRVTEIVFQTKQGALGWSGTWAPSADAANAGTPGTHVALTRRQTVPLEKYHNSEIKTEIRYRDEGGQVRAIALAHTYDLDTEPEVDPPSAELDDQARVRGTVSGDEDCTQIYVAVNREPTLSSYDAVVVGRRGSYSTTITLTPAQEGVVYARGWNAQYGLGTAKPGKVSRAGRETDASGKVVLDWLNGLISITDSQPRERVRLGKLGVGLTAYGIEIYGPDGKLILGADGLGLEVVEGKHIKAKTITADHIQTQTLEAEIARIARAEIGVAIIGTAQIENLTATVANIADARITLATIKTAQIENLDAKIATIADARITQATITTAQITNLTSETATIAQAEIDKAQIRVAQVVNFSAETATIADARIKVAVIDGAQIKDLSVVNGKIVSLDAGKITTGTIKDAISGQRLTLDLNNALLTIRDLQATPKERVRLGKLGLGAQDYGLEVRDAAGKLILGASGLGVAVVGPAQLLDGAVGDAALDTTSSLARTLRGSNTRTIHGGGDISWVGNTLSWTQRFISLPDVNSSAGHFNFGPLASVGIPAWQALIYRVAVGANELSHNHVWDGSTGWRVIDYFTYAAPSPGSGFVDYLVGVHNGDTGMLYLWDGRAIPAGKTIRGGFSVPDATIGNAHITDLSADKITTGRVRNYNNTVGIAVSGGPEPTWQNFVDLAATGANPWLQHNMLSLNADGSGTLTDALLMLSFFSL